MTPTEVKAKFDRYQEVRNTYIAMMADGNVTMHVIPDPEVTDLLMIMRSIYDFAYQQAISDSLSVSFIEFPNDSKIKEC